MWPPQLLHLLLLLQLLLSERAIAALTFSVAENSPTPIVAIGSVASSSCSPPFQSLNLPAGKFTLAADGVIRTAQPLDREEQEEYSFDIVCSAAVAAVTVRVLDRNDNAPLFSSSSIEISQPENIAIPATLPLAEVSDADASENSLDRVQIVSGNSGNRFSVKMLPPSSSGRHDLQLLLQSPLDFESQQQHTLTLLATDTGGLSSSATVRLLVLNVNDETPSFGQSLYSVNVSENASEGTEVLQLTATDRDRGEFGRVRFHINRRLSEKADHFTLDAVSGVVRLSSQRLDYEKKQHHTIVVDATDGLNNATAMVIVRVLDINDMPPQVSLTNLTVGLLTQSASAGQPVLRVEVVDPERPADPVVVTLHGEGVENGSFELATLQRNAFVVRVGGVGRLNAGRYAMWLIAVDAGLPPMTTRTELLLKVEASNQYRPRFAEAVAYATVKAGARVGQRVAMMAAIDPDGAGVRFAKLKDTVGGFSVDAVSGEVTVSRSPLPCGRWRLIVGATDLGLPALSSNASLNVFVTNSELGNRHWPRFSQPSVTTLLPAAALDGCFAQLQATDADCGSPLTFSLSEEAVGNVAEAFVVEQFSGRVCGRNASAARRLGQFVTLPVAASDSAYKTFAVLHLRVADAAPAVASGFALVEFVVDVSESASVGTNVATAFGRECSGYSLITSGGGHFSLNSTTGRLQLKSALDFESGPNILELVVACGGLPSRLTVRVRVQDANDNRPVCDSAVKEAIVTDAATAGTEVARLNCSDADSDTVLAYFGDFKDFWLTSSGRLLTKSSISHLAGSRQLLQLRACDSGGLCTNSSLVVEVVDSNDNPPTFSQPAGYWFRVSEAARIGTHVGNVSANDVDLGLNAEITFRVIDVEGDKSMFWIDSRTGALHTASLLDRESKSTHSVKVIASDRGSSSRSASVIVSIFVTDVDDSAPRMSRASYSLKATTTTPAGSCLLVIEASDPDLNSLLKFSIVGDVADELSVDTGTGAVLVSGLQPLAIGTRTGRVVVADSAGHSSFAEVSLHVVKVTDSWPSLKVEMSVSESAPIGHQLGRLPSPTPSRPTLFSIVDASDSSLWVSAETGGVFLRRQLDREEASSVSVRIGAYDVGNSSWNPLLPFQSDIALRVTVLDENDNVPTFAIAAPTVAIPEDTPAGHEIFHFFADDSDAGVNGSVHFRLVADSADAVQLDAATGRLQLRRQIDREVIGDRIHVVVEAEDSCWPPACRLSSVASLTIIVADVNDNAPSLAVSQNAFATFNDAAGAIVMHVEAFDLDAGVNGSLRLQVSPNDTVDLDEFGLVRLRRRLTSDLRLNFSASDGGGRSRWTTASLKLFAEGGASLPTPRFVQRRFVASVSASSASGQDVVLLRVVQQNRPIRFRLPAGQFKEQFQIDANSGQLRLARRLTSSRQSFSLTAVVQFADNPLLLDACVVEVSLLSDNRHAPVFGASGYFSEVPEGVAYSDLLTVAASDPDANSMPPRYELVGDVSSSFILDPISGRLSCSALDASVASSYSFNVTASDAAGLSASVPVDIHVSGVNRHAPTFSRGRYLASLSESAEVGTLVLKVEASDADAALNGRVVYRIQGRSGHFGIDSDTGEIRLARRVDRELAAVESFVVVASDSSRERPRSAQVSVDVVLVDSNDNRPRLTRSSAYQHLKRSDTSAGVLRARQLLATFAASDADVTRQNSALQYSLLTNSELAEVDTVGGQLRLRRSLNLSSNEEGVGFRLFRVRVSDTGRPVALFTDALAVLQLRVTSSREPSPLALEASNLTVEVSEAAGVGQCLLLVAAGGTANYCAAVKVAAAVAAAAAAADVAFEIVGGNEEGIFGVNGSDGHLYISNASKLNYEQQQQYQLLLLARTPQQAVACVVTVNILNADDNHPTFVQANYSATVAEKALAGTAVITVVAYDLDSVVKYRLLGSDLFEVGEDTGVVSVKSPPDFEHRSQHQLQVVAASVDNPLQTARCIVIVDIVNIDNQMPQVTQPPVVLVTDELMARLGTRLVKVNANDLDGFPALQFEMRPRSEFLALGRFSGELWIVAAATAGWHNFTVQVSDSSNTVSTQLSVLVNTSINSVTFKQNSYAFSLASGSDSSHLIGQLEVSGEGRMSILPDTQHPAPFRLDSNGRLYPSQPITEPGEFVFAVEAAPAKSIGQSDYASVRVSVLPANRHAPTFTSANQSIAVSESSRVGRVVGKVMCTDPDPAQTVSVRVISDSSPVQAVLHTGVIVLVAQLDREVQQQHVVRLVCTDSGEPKRSASTYLMLQIQDSNDNPPELIGAPYSTILSPPIRNWLSKPILQLAATDQDSGSNSLLSFRLLGGSCCFSINSSSGEVTLTSPPPTLLTTLVIVASDSPTSKSEPPRSALTVATIHSPSLPAPAPVFPVNPLVLLLPEDAPVGSFVGHLPSTCGLSPSSSSSFTQSGSSLLTASSLDFELQRRFQLSVNCSASARLVVLLLDVDEFAPEFNSGSGGYSLELNSTVTAGQQLLQVAATDRDAGRAGRVEFSLVGNDDSRHFRIDPASGRVFVREGFGKAGADGRVAMRNFSFLAGASSERLSANSTISLRFLVPSPPTTKPQATVAVAGVVAASLAAAALLLAVAAAVAVAVARKRHSAGKSRRPPPPPSPPSSAGDYDSCFDSAAVPPSLPPPRTLTELTQLSDEAEPRDSVEYLRRIGVEELPPPKEFQPSSFGFKEFSSGCQLPPEPLLSFGGTRLPGHLASWTPQYQPLASLFAEIAQLKDESLSSSYEAQYQGLTVSDPGSGHSVTVV